MSNRKRRVLVVDDDERTARLLARLLTEDGFDVEVVTDGVAAMARLSNGEGPTATDRAGLCSQYEGHHPKVRQNRWNSR